MLCFPQLSSGAISQFPGAKRVVQRTVVNEQADGRAWKLADPGWPVVEWRLELAGLTAAEWSALEALFNAVEGRLNPFVFLDPFGNLLAWSEELSAAVWSKGPSLEVTSGLEDPLGGDAASRVRNTGGAAEELGQSLSIPGWYQYAFSVYARSAAAGEITLFQRTAASAASRVCAVGPAWTRLALGAQLGDSEETVSFGVSVPAGATVELFGFQVEAQAGASGYKKAAARGGVYENAFFADDVLAMTSQGPGEHSCAVRIRSAG